MASIKEDREKYMDLVKFQSLNPQQKKMKKILLLCASLSLVLLQGCYSLGPQEGEVSTVPVTNNPNAMPGPMKTNSLPSIF
jgi:hypothetical protein